MNGYGEKAFPDLEGHPLTEHDKQRPDNIWVIVSYNAMSLSFSKFDKNPNGSDHPAIKLYLLPQFLEKILSDRPLTIIME